MQQGKVDTLLGTQVSLEGNIFLAGGSTQINGSVRGNITSQAQGQKTTLIINEQASVEGDISASIVFIKGKVQGTIQADEKVILLSDSAVDGDIYYRSIEMQLGAKVNGKFICQDDAGSGAVQEHSRQDLSPAYEADYEQHE